MTSRSKMAVAFGALALLALGAVAAFYSGQGRAGNSTCSAAAAKTARLKPLAKGEVAAVQVASKPEPVPDLAFEGPDGKPMSLSAFRGRTVLVNLWATWCPPCLLEMPALATLQKTLGGPDFEVVTINIDTRNLDKPRDWLAKKDIVGLTYYADPQAKVFQDLRAAKKVEGMPVSLLVDPEGCELALLQGPAEWASADAMALIRAALGR
ncbi:thiol:disulfide interchange protein TlpA [Bosea sp. (in: a-proteobacteria)]|uniref:thiol:disulfide interchange protein TlpA n=1 Tax=Bosea sp. (in: a-proteobacteria) TaxID=1871050 RepID=UPI002FCC1799